jgi:hypothetical protein
MSYNHLPPNQSLPAPCIIDTGILVNKRDMQRLLSDLSRVRYIHEEDGQILRQGEGYILEVFADPCQSTIVANQTLYLNVHSFDYLELTQSESGECCFSLVQDQRRLKLMPLSNPIQEHANRSLNTAALEAVVAEVLSANWDVCIDDDENFSP